MIILGLLVSSRTGKEGGDLKGQENALDQHKPKTVKARIIIGLLNFNFY